MRKHPTMLCEASESGLIWRFWCQHCARHHYHSAGSGHRVAHCEHYPNGYVLCLKERGNESTLGQA